MPSARERHKTLTDWARQMLVQLRRWLPQRELVVVADSSFAAFWYVKSCPTFVDALALVRSYLWAARLFQRSATDTKLIKVPSDVFGCWLETLCYAA